MRRGDARRRIEYLLPILPIVAAVLLLAASLLPYAWLKAYMDSLSSDGEAESFTLGLYTSVVAKARLGAAALVVLGVALGRFRRPIIQSASEQAASAVAYLRRLAADTVVVFRREPAAHWAIVLAVVAVGIWLRARSLDQPVNYDESFTYITYVSRPLVVALSDLSYANNHLFHTLLAHVSTRVFGSAPWALRLPAFLAGCALIPLTYAVARRLGSGSSGIVAASLVATSQALVGFSAFARGYTLVVLCFLVMLLLAADIVATDERGAWVWMALVAAIGFYSVPVFVYPYGVVLAWIVLARWRNSDRIELSRAVALNVTVTGFIVALCYLPPLAVSGMPGAWRSGSTSETVSGVWFDLTRGMPPVLLLVVAIGVVTALWGSRDRAVLALTAALVMWPVTAVLVERVLAPARAWVFVLPATFVVAASGFDRVIELLRRRRGGKMSFVPALATGAFALALAVYASRTQPLQFNEENGSSDEVYMKTDSEAVALYLGDHLRSSDALVAAFPLDYPIEYYVRLHHLPFSLLARSAERAPRHLVVANRFLDQSVEKVLAKKHLNPARVVRVQPLRQFAFSSLYEVELNGEAVR